MGDQVGQKPFLNQIFNPIADLFRFKKKAIEESNEAFELDLAAEAPADLALSPDSAIQGTNEATISDAYDSINDAILLTQQSLLTDGQMPRLSAYWDVSRGFRTFGKQQFFFPLLGQRPTNIFEQSLETFVHADDGKGWDDVSGYMETEFPGFQKATTFDENPYSLPGFYSGYQYVSNALYPDQYNPFNPFGYSFFGPQENPLKITNDDSNENLNEKLNEDAIAFADTETFADKEQEQEEAATYIPVLPQLPEEPVYYQPRRSYSSSYRSKKETQAKVVEPEVILEIPEIDTALFVQDVEEEIIPISMTEDLAVEYPAEDLDQEEVVQVSFELEEQEAVQEEPQTVIHTQTAELETEVVEMDTDPVLIATEQELTLGTQVFNTTASESGTIIAQETEGELLSDHSHNHSTENAVRQDLLNPGTESGATVASDVQYSQSTLSADDSTDLTNPFINPKN